MTDPMMAYSGFFRIRSTQFRQVAPTFACQSFGSMIPVNSSHLRQ